MEWYYCFKRNGYAGPGISNGRKLSAGPEKSLEDVPNIETTMKQQTLSPTATADVAINIETTIAELCENGDITTIEDQATSSLLIDESLNASDSLSLAEIKSCNAVEDK
ncbi:hypothetical protein [Wolbachia pipientis]|uniref:hypothetical protein n=1 Tax=Wolbachia pipientis TaxID=955 RepID=UPI0025A34801|nr:hypothetical protein [Wolbachia pipientis]MDM8335093.1 hypothetical protein [Wolbachia pipientis]